MVRMKLAHLNREEIFGVTTDFLQTSLGGSAVLYTALTMKPEFGNYLAFGFSLFVAAKGLHNLYRFTQDIKKRFRVEEIDAEYGDVYES